MFRRICYAKDFFSNQQLWNILKTNLDTCYVLPTLVTRFFLAKVVMPHTLNQITQKDCRLLVRDQFLGRKPFYIEYLLNCIEKLTYYTWAIFKSA